MDYVACKTRGVWGHVPPGNFEKLNALRLLEHVLLALYGMVHYMLHKSEKVHYMLHKYLSHAGTLSNISIMCIHIF